MSYFNKMSMNVNNSTHIIAFILEGGIESKIQFQGSFTGLSGKELNF